MLYNSVFGILVAYGVIVLASVVEYGAPDGAYAYALAVDEELVVYYLERVARLYGVEVYAPLVDIGQIHGYGAVHSGSYGRVPQRALYGGRGHASAGLYLFFLYVYGQRVLEAEGHEVA